MKRLGLSITIIVFGMIAMFISVGIIERTGSDYIEVPWNIYEKQGYVLTEEQYERYPYIVLNLKGTDFKIVIDLEITIRMKTKKGEDKTVSKTIGITYQPVNYYDFLLYGIGEEMKDGEWHVMCRNIKEDLKNTYKPTPGPDLKAVRIEKALVRNIRYTGDLSSEYIRFYKHRPEQTKITEPERLRLVREEELIVFEDGNIARLKNKWTFLNEIGEPMRKYLNDYTTHMVWAARELNSRDEVLSTRKYYYFYDYSNPFESLLWEHDHIGRLKMLGCSLASNSLYIYFDENGDPLYMQTYDPPSKAYSYYQFNNPEGVEIISIWEGEKKKNEEKINRREKGRSPEEKIADFLEFKRAVFERGVTFIKKYIYQSNYVDNKLESRTLRIFENDSAGIEYLSLKETRYENPLLTGFIVPKGIWQEIEHYNGTGKITRKRQLHGERMGGGIFAELVCDYDINNKLQDVRIIYNKLDKSYNVKERWIGQLDPVSDTRYIKTIVKEEYNPFNMDPYTFELLDKQAERKRLKQYEVRQDNLVLDGDMKALEDYKPVWKPEGAQRSVRCYKTNGALRIEHIEEDAPDSQPVYAVQFIPVKGGVYEFSVNYRIKSEPGTACMRLDWVAIEDLWSTRLIDELSINLLEYRDTNNTTDRIEKFIVTPPNESGLLILKIGAKSVVEYTNVGLKTYVAPTPVILPMPEEIPEFGFEYAQNIGSSLGDSYSFRVEDAKVDSTGAKEYVIQELYKDTPVFGGTIILGVNKDDSVMAVEDNTINIKEPQNRPWPKRTTKGEELHRVLKEKIGARDEDIPKYDAEMVIASNRGDGSPEDTSYGWHIRGPGVDRVVELETGRDLYRIERASIAPPTTIRSPKPKTESAYLSVIRGIYLRFKDWFINLFQQIKRRI